MDLSMKELKSDNEIIKIIQDCVKRGVDSKIWSHHFQTISERHTPLFFKMTDRWISKKFKEKRLDYFKDKDTHIFQFLLDFDENKNTKFSTYLGNRVKWDCMNSYNKDLNCCEINCPDQLMYNCPDNKDYVDINSVCEAMEMIKKDEDSRIYKIFTLRYLVGKGNKVMPWSDVCNHEDINLSVQGCINVHDNYINKIRKGK